MNQAGQQLKAAQIRTAQRWVSGLGRYALLGIAFGACATALVSAFSQIIAIYGRSWYVAIFMTALVLPVLQEIARFIWLRVGGLIKGGWEKRHSIAAAFAFTFGYTAEQAVAGVIDSQNSDFLLLVWILAGTFILHAFITSYILVNFAASRNQFAIFAVAVFWHVAFQVSIVGFAYLTQRQIISIDERVFSILLPSLYLLLLLWVLATRRKAAS